MSKINETMMQYFEWYLPPDCKLWEKVRTQASYLETIGITSIWLPPAYKCIGGKNDTGYAVYDLYDLGEFDQKGTIETKYGTKQEYIDAIKGFAIFLMVMGHVIAWNFEDYNQICIYDVNQSINVKIGG